MVGWFGVLCSHQGKAWEILSAIQSEWCLCWWQIPVTLPKWSNTWSNNNLFIFSRSPLSIVTFHSWTGMHPTRIQYIQIYIYIHTFIHWLRWEALNLCEICIPSLWSCDSYQGKHHPINTMKNGGFGTNTFESQKRHHLSRVWFCRKTTWSSWYQKSNHFPSFSWAWKLGNASILNICLPSNQMTRWWFQRFFTFTPNPGEMIQFDDHIFQLGWNYQLDDHEKVYEFPSPKVVLPNLTEIPFPTRPQTWNSDLMVSALTPVFMWLGNKTHRVRFPKILGWWISDFMACYPWYNWGSTTFSKN